MTTLVRFAAPNSFNDVSEGAGSLTHNLTLSAPSSQTVTVTVRGPNDGGAGYAGSAGSADLGVADQVITFAPGQTTATFTTAIHEDLLYEGNEYYSFEIVSATGAEIDLTSGARNLSGQHYRQRSASNPTVRFGTPNGVNDVSEGAGSLTHNLTLSAPSSQTVTVTVRGARCRRSAGSADLGVADQVITFAPGQTTATFTTAVHEDALYEGNEFYSFRSCLRLARRSTSQAVLDIFPATLSTTTSLLTPQSVLPHPIALMTFRRTRARSRTI